MSNGLHKTEGAETKSSVNATHMVHIIIVVVVVIIAIDSITMFIVILVESAKYWTSSQASKLR